MKSSFALVTVVLLLFLSASAQAEEITPLPEETVTAAAEREDKTLLSPGSVTVIRPEEMRGEQKSLPDLLKQIPGLHIVEARGRGAYTVASVRGSTAAQVSVFLDGMLVNLASEAAVDLSAIPADNIERIEVYRGYVPSRFAGASMGGVINIITKKPEDAGSSVSVGFGSFGLFKTNLAHNMSLWDGKLFLGANFEQSDGDFKYTNDNNTPYTPGDDYTAKRQNNAYKDTDILMKWNGGGWFARGAWKKKDRDLPYGAPGADKPESPAGAKLDTETFDFSVGKRLKAGELDWGFKAEYLRQEKVYDDPNNVVGGWGETHNRYLSDRIIAALDGSLAVGRDNFLEFFTNYSREELKVRGDIIDKFGGIGDFSREEWNFQLQDTISLNRSGTFWLTPIVRYNASDGDGDFSFALAATAKLNDSWTLRASGGSYNRAPNLYERYGDGAVIRPASELKWEKGTQWDIAAEWRGRVGSADVTADISYFARDADNLIEFEMMNPRYGIYRNIGEAKIRGVELESTLKRDPWSAMLSATWMESENTTPDDYRSGKRLPNRPEYEGFFRISRKFRDDRASAFAELRYMGNNYFDSSEQIKMDDLLTVGVGARYSFSDSAKMILGVDDIFDKGPETNLAAVGNGPVRTLWYPLQGRRVYLTVDMKF